MKHGSGRIILWGCFAGKVTGALQKIFHEEERLTNFANLKMEPKKKEVLRKFSHVGEIFAALQLFLWNTYYMGNLNIGTHPSFRLEGDSH